MQVGARGDLGDGWSYDVYGQYGATVFEQSLHNEFSKQRVQNALEVDPLTGKCFAAEKNAQGVIADSSCVPLNIFNGLGSITPGALSYVSAAGHQQGYTEEQILSGSITGDLGEWGFQSPWAKSPVSVAFGSEYRAEYLYLDTDQEYALGNPAVTDLYGAGGATPSVPRSGFNVVEGFGEVKIPVVQEMPWVEDLSFNGGYRYSSYSTVGHTTAYKYGVEYQPIDDIRFRASFERAVRAPNVLEAFAPSNVVLFSGAGAVDPCATSVVGKCAGVPNAGSGAAGLLACPASQCNQQIGGNQNLKPEVGNTRTAGVVLTPTFISGFSATIDYFNIDASSFISTVNPNVTLAQCYGAAATAASESFFCPFVNRNAQGQIYGGGFVSAQTLNTGFLHTKGFDFEANYAWNLDDWSWTKGNGSLQFAFLGTWLQSLQTEPLAAQGIFPGTGHYECAGLYGTTCLVPAPKWRHRLRVTWETPWDIDLSANWRWLGSVFLDRDTPQPLLVGAFDKADRSINSFWYLDLAADWNVRSGVDLHVGMNNVFDRLPPVIGSGALPAATGNDNTFPGTYDSLGRTMFVGATIKY